MTIDIRPRSAAAPGADGAWAQRFWSKVERTPSCWLWTGTLRCDGYPVFWLGDRMVRAHRVAYELLVGPIPPGLELDHLCRVTQCINPAHLEPVTRAENMRRARTSWRSERPACVNGHDFSPENTIRWRGWRLCRACRATQARRHRERMAAAR